MKLVWCPKTAFKAYTETVKAYQEREGEDGSAAAELVAAMAGGWKSQLMVDAWGHSSGAATSIGLAEAARHTSGRRVCVVPDERAAADYGEAAGHAAAAEVAVGEAEEAMEGLEGVDMLVVDWMRRDAARVLREVRPGARGMVVVCMDAGGGLPPAEAVAVAGGGRRVVRSVYLPVGSGVQVLHVGTRKGPGAEKGRRWIRHVDRRTGEEHVFRRQ